MPDTQEKVRRQVKAAFVGFHELVVDLAGNKQVVRRTEHRGQVIDLPKSEAERLKDHLVPEGQEILGTTTEDARAALERALAPSTQGQGIPGPAPSISPPSLGAVPVGDVVTGDTGGPDSPPVGQEPSPATGAQPGDADLEARIREDKLTVDDTVALADDDPARARRVLDAEAAANDGKPRKGVEDKLQAIIDR